MSVISFTSNKQGVQDLLAALPAPAQPVAERTNAADLSQDDKPGFNELLRDSSDSQNAIARTESPEAADTQPRSEASQDAGDAADKPEAAEQEASSNESGNSTPEDASDNDATDQDAGQASTEGEESGPKDSSEEAQVQAAANAASAQLNVVDAVVRDQPKVQAQANVAQQIDLTKSVEASAGETSAKQSQSSSTNLLPNGTLPAQLPGNSNGPVVQAGALAGVQPVAQQGDLSQGQAGDKGSDGQSTASTSVGSTASSTSSNAAVTSAFTVPDQSSGEARLPLNTTTAIQTADAARQAQAQPALPTSDNDGLNTARLTRGLANAVQQRGGAVTLRLTPPEMGTVRIQMQITGTSVSASFHAESASAQTLLTTQLAQLRSSLESKGMSVERLTVQPLAATAQSNNANQSQNQSDGQQQGQSQQQGSNDGRSRSQYSGDSSDQQSSDQQQDNGSTGPGPRGFFEQLTDNTGEQAA